MNYVIKISILMSPGGFSTDIGGHDCREGDGGLDYGFAWRYARLSCLKKAGLNGKAGSLGDFNAGTKRWAAQSRQLLAV